MQAVAYYASKAAAIGFTRALASGWGRRQRRFCSGVPNALSRLVFAIVSDAYDVVPTFAASKTP